jgi:hypothetical protein
MYANELTAVRFSDIPEKRQWNATNISKYLFLMFPASEKIHFYIFNYSMHKHKQYYVKCKVLTLVVMKGPIFWRATPLTDYTALYLRRYNSSEITVVPRTSLHQPSVITPFFSALIFNFNYYPLSLARYFRCSVNLVTDTSLHTANSTQNTYASWNLYNDHLPTWLRFSRTVTCGG